MLHNKFLHKINNFNKKNSCILCQFEDLLNPNENALKDLDFFLRNNNIAVNESIKPYWQQFSSKIRYNSMYLLDLKVETILKTSFEIIIIPPN